MLFVPQSKLGGGFHDEAQQKQLLNALKKFGDLEIAEKDSSYVHDTTRCAIDAYNTERVDLKNDFKSAKEGMQKIFNASNNYVNSQLTAQEKQILGNVIEQYKANGSSCGFANINGLEGKVLDALVNELVTNNVTGGQKMNAADVNKLVANVTKASNFEHLSYDEKAALENNLNIVKKVANSLAK